MQRFALLPEFARFFFAQHTSGFCYCVPRELPVLQAIFSVPVGRNVSPVKLPVGMYGNLSEFS